MKKSRLVLLMLAAVCVMAAAGCRAAAPELSPAETEETEVPSVGSGTPEIMTEGGTETEAGQEAASEAEAYLESMTLEEKIAQLFIVLPEALVDVDCVTQAGEQTRQAIAAMPVGGFVYLSGNLQSGEQVRQMLQNVQKYMKERTGLPAFLCVDEEGGTVARISGSGRFDVPKIGDMSEIGRSGDKEQAYQCGVQMGVYLSELGFNVDFAPVADVLSNPENEIVKKRSFGTDPALVSGMAAEVARGLQEQGVCSTYKHFPGHGATEGDTHEGYAYTAKTLDELQACELVPFQDGIQNSIDFIMVGHISLPEVIGDNTPASLSGRMIRELLRDEMGYDGIVITDALNMGAIVQQYTSDEAAVKALLAGADMILMPEDFPAAYAGVCEAVKTGVITEERIDESVRRILRVKLSMK